MGKKMIFHLPFRLLVDVPSGSVVRPLKMMRAFTDIGYEVDLVMGSARERRRQIELIKRNIADGGTYDFVYSESSNLPTLLTEDHRLPLHPCLDFGFLRYCRARGIKVGLFYRDIYWKFAFFGKSVPLVKRLPALPLYRYDIYQYSRLVDILFVPSLQMAAYIPYHGRVAALPPGADSLGDQDTAPDREARASAETLHILYVGGLKDVYDKELLVAAVSRNTYLTLTLCCREDEWREERARYAPYLNERIRVIHKSGPDLVPYYRSADLCSLFVEPVEYRSFAMPVKLFEYLAFKKPIIASRGTAAGSFVEEHDVGWNIAYSATGLESLLEWIESNREVLLQKRANIESILPAHTWEKRAEQVATDLAALSAEESHRT